LSYKYMFSELNIYCLLVVTYNYTLYYIINTFNFDVTNVNKKHSLHTHLKFIIPSLLVIFLFMTPIKSEGSFTIPIAILAGLIEDGLGAYLSLIMMIIIVLTAILTLLVKMIGGNKFSHMPFIQNL